MITNNFPVALQQIFKGYQDTDIRVTKNDAYVNTLTIKIFNGSTEITYSQISSGTITFVKDDDNIVQGALTINASNITYTMGTNEIAFPGMVRVSIQLYGSLNERLTPAKFKFYVDDDLSDASAMPSTTQLLINEDIEDLDERVTALESNPVGGGGSNVTESIINGYIKIDDAETNVYTHPSTHPAAMISDLADVAITGDYNDLLNKPAGGTGDTVTASEINGNIQVNSGEVVVYEHPATHPATMIEEDSTHRFATDERMAAWDSGGYTHPDTHSATMITGLATVATSGSYNDLSNKPSIGGAQIDWSNATSYSANAIVSRNGKLYTSAQGLNLNHDPAIATNLITYWKQASLSDLSNALYYGIVGNDSTDNTTAINNAITALNAAEQKKLHFPSGYYRINGTVSAPASFEIELDRYARIRQNHATAHAVQLKSRSFIHGGWIEMMHTTASGACIYLDGDDMVVDVLIENMRLMGGYWTSMGIFCDGTNPAGTIENCYTMYPQVSNCVIRDHLYGIKCQANANAGNGGSWCTAMQCENTQFWDNGHHIWLSKGCGGVQFSNFAMEGGSHVTEYMWTDADIGLFKAPTYYDNGSQIPVCHFGPNSTGNIFEAWYNPNETNNAFPDDNPTGNNFAVYPSMVRTIAALPGASALNRGAIRLVRGGAGVADATYICRKKADGAYEWARLD